MRSQVLRQAAGLARQATTLAEAGSWTALATAAESLAASTARQAAASPLAGVLAAASPGCRPAAAQPALPWRQALCTLASPAAVQQPAAAPAAAARTPWHSQQQRRLAASAQAEPSSSTQAGTGSGGLVLSDSAVERLKELQAQSAGPVMLRVTVEGGGCSGFQYEFSIEEEGHGGAGLAETDRLFEREGVRVVCDDISLEFLQGATVDYESDLMRSAFVVVANPNAASSCGCGSSFVAK